MKCNRCHKDVKIINQTHKIKLVCEGCLDKNLIYTITIDRTGQVVEMKLISSKLKDFTPKNH